MSLTVLAQRIHGIKEEHLTVIREHESTTSPYITYMEQYYFRHPRNYRSKIASATHIPQAVRRHMIRHLDIVLGRRRVRVSSRRRALRLIIGRRDIEKVEVKRFKKQPAQVFWRRDSLGRIYLHDAKTGRFLHTTEKEKGVIHRWTKKTKRT